jgi:hypothetical protein
MNQKYRDGKAWNPSGKDWDSLGGVCRPRLS